ncbi:MAG: hypothetical protein E7222_12810 [Clostridiales bacterium]|nr:hypothetical protein [Clostridiales bacterium]
MNGEISEMTRLLEVEIEGFKFAVELGKDALKFLQRLAVIWANGLKWGLVDKNWRYGKEAGETNIYNLKSRCEEGITQFCMQKEDYAAWQKFAKKTGIPYVLLPCTEENSIAFAIGTRDVELYNFFQENLKKSTERQKVKEGLNDADDIERVDAEVVYEPPRSMDWSEYMYENGFMDCSDEEFDEVIRNTYGEQCTTLTQYREKFKETDPAKVDAQKKRSIEIYRKGVVADLQKEARFGAQVIVLERERFAGVDRDTGIAYFQISKDRWAGISSNRIMKDRDGNFQAVLNKDTTLTINTVVGDDSRPNGYRFENLGTLSVDQIRMMDKNWRENIENERRNAREVVTEISEQTKDSTKETAIAIAGARGRGGRR